MIRADLLSSDRVREANTSTLIDAVIPYCLRPAPSAIPLEIVEFCLPLTREDYSIVSVFEEDACGRMLKVVRLHHWPSWLRKGGKKVVADCALFFYGQDPRPEGFCPLCGEVTSTFWDHIFSPCSALPAISSHPDWQAFCNIISAGFPGFALFALFPLLAAHLPDICPGWGLI